MKKTVVIVSTMIVSASIIGVACFAGCNMKKDDHKQTVSGYLDQEGNTVDATVDITGGYSAEFARGAIYLNEKDDINVAIGMTLDKEVYDEYYAQAQADENHKEVNGGVIFSEEGQMGYLCPVGDSAYFAVFAEDVTQNEMESIANRFTVEPEVY